MPLTVCTTVSKPLTLRPRPQPSEGRQRDVHDSRTDRGQVLGRQSTLRESPWSVPLGEDVGLSHQLAHGLQITLFAQVQVGGELAVSSVVFLGPYARKMRSGDFHHVRAMLGEGSSAGRAGQHAREVQNSHS